MCNKKIRLTAMLVLLSMLIGMIWLMPTAAGAEVTDTTSVVPADIKPYSQYTAEEKNVTALSGEGTEEAPYLISDAAEFEFFRGQVRSATEKITAYYRLTNDIVFNTDTDISDTHYSLGGLWNTKVSFGGTLDGDGHTIYNMYSNGANDVPALFHNLATEATIKNLNFDGVRLVSAKGTATSGGAAAILAHGNCNATIENIHAKNVVLVGYAAGGLIAGKLLQNGCVRNCSVEGISIDGYTAGGIVGSATGGAVIENCTVSGAVSGSFFIGGIAGYNTDDNIDDALYIKNCTNNAEITATTSGAGILGAAQKANGNYNCKFVISDCTNNGEVTTQKYAGGIVGTSYMTQGQIQLLRCVNNGNITAETNTVAMAGGMISRIDNLTSSLTTMITGCVNDGAVTSNADAGGMIGQCTVKSIGIRFTNCANTGDISGKSTAGGFIGYFTNGTAVIVHNSANRGNVGAINAANNAGGFFGSVTTTDVGVTINNSLMMANINGVNTAGCIAGYASGSSNNAKVLTLNNIWVQGTISASTQAVTYGSGFSLAGSTNYGNFDITLLISGTKQNISSSANAVDAAVFTDGTAQASLNDYVTSKNANLGNLDVHTPWTTGALGQPVHVTTTEFSGAALSLGSSMTLNLILPATAVECVANDTVTVKITSVDTEIAVTARKDGNSYVASLTGIRAADMARQQSFCYMVSYATATGGSELRGTHTLRYCVMDYITRMYAKDSTPTDVKTVLEAMVGYGVAAERSAYGTNAVATTAAAHNIVSPAFTDGTHVVENVLDENDKAVINAMTNNQGVGASLTGGIALEFAGMTPGATISITGDGIEAAINCTADENGTVRIDELHAGMIRNQLTLTFGDGSTATFSIGNYLETRRTGDEQALVEATITYMMAVRAFALANQPE